jgi:hypothetical protein
MIELPLVIDCLSFFFFFSLLATKVYNYSICLLVVRSCMTFRHKHLGSGMAAGPKARPTHLGSGIVCQTRTPGSKPDPHLGLASMLDPSDLGLTVMPAQTTLV